MVTVEYFLFFAGFFAAETISRIANPNIILRINLGRKMITKKLHHFYLVFISPLFYILDHYFIFWLTLGAGIHDVLMELKNVISRKFK